MIFAHSSFFSLNLHSNGISGKAVQEASAEALTLLSRQTAEGSNSQISLEISGDAAPNLALGQIAVLQGRYLVTYRMIHSILVMLISEPTANAFVCLRLLDASGKILVGACKGVDVTPERLSKKYADVHSCLDGLVSGGLMALPPAFTHASATDGKLLAVPLSTADAARRLKRAQGALGGKVFTAEKAGEPSENEPTPLPMPETPSKKDGKQFTVDGGDPLRGVEFHIPADALPPPPARAMGAKRRPPSPPREAPFVPPAAFKGAMEEEAKGPEEAEGFGAFGEVEVMEAEKQEEAEKTKSGEWEAEFAAEAGPAGPSISIKDLQESLQLVEIYRGQVVAGLLHRATIDGAVRRRLAPFGLETAKFRLLPSSTLVTNACLQVATRNTAHASEVDDNFGFTARLTGAPMDCSYIKYALPSVACLPPLQIDLAVAPPSGTGAPPASLGWEGLIVLRYVSNPELPGPLLDVIVEVDLAPELAVLVKTSPSAQWSPDECRLKWNLGKISPGECGIARALVGAKPGTVSDRAEVALKEETKARVLFTGWPGKSLSGAGFEVAMPAMHEEKKEEGEKENKSDEYHKGKAVWFGELLVKP